MPGALVMAGQILPQTFAPVLPFSNQAKLNIPQVIFRTIWAANRDGFCVSCIFALLRFKEVT